MLCKRFQEKIVGPERRSNGSLVTKHNEHNLVRPNNFLEDDLPALAKAAAIYKQYTTFLRLSDERIYDCGAHTTWIRVGTDACVVVNGAQHIDTSPSKLKTN